MRTRAAGSTSTATPPTLSDKATIPNSSGVSISRCREAETREDRLALARQQEAAEPSASALAEALSRASG
jgi:hypothetical protein